MDFGLFEIKLLLQGSMVKDKGFPALLLQPG